MGKSGPRQSYYTYNQNRYLLQGVLDHSGDQSSQVGTRQLETRIGVDLNHPRVHVLINHEVIAVNLKRERFAARVDLPAASSDRVLDHLLHLGYQVFVQVALYLVGVKVLLELGVAQLVAALKLTVVVKLLLDGIVGEMDISVVHVFEGVLLAACP